MQNLLSVTRYFTLFGKQIYFYGIISALSYLLGVVLCCVFAKKRGFKTEDIITLACYVIPLCVIGARIYYVLFELDRFTNFWQVLDLRTGGLAFYGGLIGGAVGVVLYCLIHKKNFFALVDISAPALIISQSLGRWGNFVNQEAFGPVVTNPNLQWFPYAVYIENLSQWPMATFFYESFWNFVSFWILLFMLYKVNFKQNGMLAAYYFVLYGLGRMWIEGLRTDSLYIGPFRVSQLLSAVFVVFGLSVIIFNAVRNRKKKDSFSIIINTIKRDL